MITLKRWKHLGVVEFRNVGELEIELNNGCDTPESRWSLNQRVDNRYQPFAVKTIWISFGYINKTDAITNSLYLLSPCQELEQHLATLYNHEFKDIFEHREKSIEDLVAVKQVGSSVFFGNGDSIVGLPGKKISLDSLIMSA